MVKPYLIQRAKFENDSQGHTIDSVLSFDYMGSAEFEFGALPKSLKRITSGADKLSKHELPYCISGITGDSLYVVSVGEISDEYLEHILSMSRGELRLKESSHLDTIVKGKDYRGDKIKRDSWCNCEAWWDIENDIMFTFGQGNAARIVKSIVATRDKKKLEKCEGWY